MLGVFQVSDTLAQADQHSTTDLPSLSRGFPCGVTVGSALYSKAPGVVVTTTAPETSGSTDLQNCHTSNAHKTLKLLTGFQAEFAGVSIVDAQAPQWS